MPPFLKPGDLVGVAASSGRVSEKQIRRGLRTLEAWGLKVRVGQFAYSPDGYFAATHDERRRDLQALLNDRAVRAVFFARGGHGMTHLLDRLDFEQFRQAPKWLVGFSDVTALHGHVHKFEVCTLHAPMLIQWESPFSQLAVRRVKDALFGQPPALEAMAHPSNRQGEGRGKLVGGCLTVLTALLGTPSMPDLDGKILFLEEVGEYRFRIDRALLQLQRAGKLQGLAGLAVGDMGRAKNDDFHLETHRIVRDRVEGYPFPVAFEMPYGHEPHNLPVVCGAEARLVVTDKGAKLSYE